MPYRGRESRNASQKFLAESTVAVRALVFLLFRTRPCEEDKSKN